MTETREVFCDRCAQPRVHTVSHHGQTTILDCDRCGNLLVVQPKEPEPIRRSGALDREPKPERSKVPMVTMLGVVWVDPATGEAIR